MSVSIQELKSLIIKRKRALHQKNSAHHHDQQITTQQLKGAKIKKYNKINNTFGTFTVVSSK